MNDIAASVISDALSASDLVTNMIEDAQRAFQNGDMNRALSKLRSAEHKAQRIESTILQSIRAIEDCRR